MLLFDFNRLTTNTCKKSGFSHKNRLLSKNERNERWLGFMQLGTISFNGKYKDNMRINEGCCIVDRLLQVEIT